MNAVQERYQALLKKWERVRHQDAAKALRDDELGPAPQYGAGASFTAAKLREASSWRAGHDD